MSINQSKNWQSMIKSGRLKRLGLAVAVASAAATTPVVAQEIEEIVVTARFQEESLQEIPLAITAISADKLEANGAQNVIDVADWAPNVTMDQLGSGWGPTLAANIRGLGFGDFKGTSDPTVSIYLDDVVLGRPTGAILDLMDLERVEVLRGPQGTLFGKNAIGGVVRLISRKPGEGDENAAIEVTTGEYDRLDVRASFGTTLIEDELFARVSAVSKSRDGWQNNVDFACQMEANGTPELAGINDGVIGWNRDGGGPGAGRGTPIMGEVGSAADNAFALPSRTSPLGTGKGCNVGTLGAEVVKAARAQLRWVVSDDLEFNFAADVTDQTSESPYDLLSSATTEASDPFLLNWYNNTVALPTWGVPWDDRFVPTSEDVNYSGFNSTLDGIETPNINDVYHTGWNATVDWSLDAVDVKLIVAERKFDAQWGRDSDASPLPINHTLDTFTHDQFSTELRISGEAFGGKTAWTVGYWYYDADDFNSNISVLMPCLFANSCIDRVDTITVEDRGLFLNTVTSLTDKLSLTIGLRRTEEDKTILQERFFRDESLVWDPLPVEVSASQTNPMVSLSYDYDDDVMFYATWQEGFRGGGTTARPSETTRVPFGPEQLENLEVGIKSDWFDNRLRLNANYYDMTYSDMQIGGAGLDLNSNAVWLTTNGGEASIKGFEIEAQATLGEHWLIDANVGHIDFQFTDLAFSDPQTRIDLGLDPGGATDINSVPGRTPDYTGALNISYFTDLSNGSQFAVRYGVTYQGETFFGANNDPLTRSPSNTISNARVTWVSPDEEWQLSLAGTNITDKRVIQSRLNFLNLFGSIQTTYIRPAEWALSIKRNF